MNLLLGLEMYYINLCAIPLGNGRDDIDSSAQINWIRLAWCSWGFAYLMLQFLGEAAHHYSDLFYTFSF